MLASENFSNSVDPIQRKKLEEELQGLEDRIWLGTIRLDILAELKRLKAVSGYGAALRNADTSRITRKTTDLARTLVTTLRDTTVISSGHREDWTRHLVGVQHIPP